ncbi:FAD-dependent monooxygenase [Acuticoccus sp. MNP-M23]|uniref:NAD(P)/FAD-dependent oxidoreductase n=1 Tax=Acuticoccus sp. MNP-M23 TaxID=3072793 RepID=UPI002814F23D|nr:FAD-dependent monooxygenase [Acuticoccus sp. MNP-M23]WMS41986.1 FAD-dependent monooxygenase [Acuticoccus sp. MNP-M23]
MSHDAIVIGAGPAGASAAIGLARQGRRVALVERTAFPRRKVCGEYLSATAMPVLHAIGVADAFRASAGPEVRRVAWYAGPQVALATMPESANGFGRALGRDALDTLLLNAARRQGVDVLQPAKATELASDGSGHRVTITLEGGTRTLHAPVVIAAHGTWEPGALPTHLPKTHAQSDFLGFKAHFNGGNLPADVMTMLTFPGGYGGLVWADGGRLSLSCCINRRTLGTVRERHGGTAAEAVLQHLIVSMDGLRDALGTAQTHGAWLAAGPIRPGLREVYAGDIFRAGNLAGEAHPIVAEGIAMAIQSGWLLARELGGVDVTSLLARQQAGARYRRGWRRQFSLRIRAAAAFAGVFTHPAAAVPLAALATRFPVLLSTGARFSGKTRALEVAAQTPDRQAIRAA